MITSGIIRKIDELGRIVLPKEIRKSLNINTGDDFQITIENNRIVLNKFEKLKNIEQEILKIIKSFISVYPYKIYLIIGNEEITNKQKVNDNVINIIQERKIYCQDNIEKIQLFDNHIEEGRIVIHPIVINSDLLGTIIVIGQERISELINTTKIINNLIKDILESK
jgi:AbrB family looped-hinge helix DNA binding protein